jgi:putative DNA primase/helicase
VTPAENLTARLGGRWHGTYGTSRCPVHDDREPSLSIRDGKQSVLVKCHAGCSPQAIMVALRRDWRLPDGRKPQHEKPKAVRSSADTRRYLLSIWHECRAISGTLAERYLRNRGIKGELPISLRYHPTLKHTDTGLLLPAMVAAVQSPDRSITGIHRTYLRADGTGKAQVPSPRKMLGTISGGAVRLAAAGRDLALGEGIETCLSFIQITGIPTWAALSTSGMRSAILPPVPLAETIFLVIDLDPAGEAAAQSAAARLSSDGRKVKLARPIAGNDMADALTRAAHAR